MQTIAIIASKKYLNNKRPERDWYDIRKFIQENRNNLNDCILFTNHYAKEILAEYGIKYVETNRKNELQCIVYLASQIAHKRIKTVLYFQDPDDLFVENPITYTLIRHCDLAGVTLLFNHSIKIWSDYYLNNKRKKISPKSKEKVAFISHDNEKPRIAKFCCDYIRKLYCFKEMIATSGTQKYIMNYLKKSTSLKENISLEIAGRNNQISHGPLGGDVIIANEIYERFQADNNKCNYLYHVIFFIDHKSNQPHLADIHVLLKSCLDPHNKVNLITNSKTAEMWAEMYLDKKL